MTKEKYLNIITKILYQEIWDPEWSQIVFPIYGEMQFGYGALRNKTHAYIRYILVGKNGHTHSKGRPRWTISMTDYYGPDKVTSFGRHNLHCEQEIRASDIKYLVDIDTLIKQVEDDLNLLRNKRKESLDRIEKGLAQK